MRQLLYYKMRQKFITKCVGFFIKECDSFITKCENYYKLRQLYYKMRRLLQIATVRHGVMLNKEILLQWKSKQTKSRKKVDPYCCAIKAMVDIPPRLKTVGYVPREISRHIFFFLTEENGKVDGFVYSTQFQPSPIPAVGLEIPLKLTFKSPNFITHQKMKDFMINLYSYDYEAKAETDEDDSK